MSDKTAYGPALVTLRRRAEFLRVRGGQRWSGAAFLIEGKARAGDGVEAGAGKARFGFTITKKLGKAHERNRMRRRLSHAIRSLAVPEPLAHWDFVVVARPAAIDMPFERLVGDFQAGLARIAKFGLGARTRGAATGEHAARHKSAEAGTKDRGA